MIASHRKPLFPVCFGAETAACCISLGEKLDGGVVLRQCNTSGGSSLDIACEGTRTRDFCVSRRPRSN